MWMHILQWLKVEVNEKAIRNIYIVNAGKFNFDYTWELHERSKDTMVAMTPSVGGVMFGEREMCQLSFCPPRPTALRGCDLTLKVSYTTNAGLSPLDTKV